MERLRGMPFSRLTAARLALGLQAHRINSMLMEVFFTLHLILKLFPYPMIKGG